MITYVNVASQPLCRQVTMPIWAVSTLAQDHKKLFDQDKDAVLKEPPQRDASLLETLPLEGKRA